MCILPYVVCYGILCHYSDWNFKRKQAKRTRTVLLMLPSFTYRISTDIPRPHCHRVPFLDLEFRSISRRRFCSGFCLEWCVPRYGTVRFVLGLVCMDQIFIQRMAQIITVWGNNGQRNNILYSNTTYYNPLNIGRSFAILVLHLSMNGLMTMIHSFIRIYGFCTVQFDHVLSCYSIIRNKQETTQHNLLVLGQVPHLPWGRQRLRLFLRPFFPYFYSIEILYYTSVFRLKVRVRVLLLLVWFWCECWTVRNTAAMMKRNIGDRKDQQRDIEYDPIEWIQSRDQSPWINCYVL